MNMQLLGVPSNRLRSIMNDIENDQENMDKYALDKSVRDLVSEVLRRCPKHEICEVLFPKRWAGRIEAVFRTKIEQGKMVFDFRTSINEGYDAFGTLNIKLV